MLNRTVILFYNFRGTYKVSNKHNASSLGLFPTVHVCPPSVLFFPCPFTDAIRYFIVLTTPSPVHVF